VNRITLPREIKLLQLKRQIRNLYCLDSVRIFFKDAEGDVIEIRNDDDLYIAILMAGVMKLILYLY